PYRARDRFGGVATVLAPVELTIAWREIQRRTAPRRCDLAAESAHELARPGGHVAYKLTHLGQPCTELGIAYFDRHHRVLQLDEHGICFGDGDDGAIDEASDARRWEARSRRSECP